MAPSLCVVIRDLLLLLLRIKKTCFRFSFVCSAAAGALAMLGPRPPWTLRRGPARLWLSCGWRREEGWNLLGCCVPTGVTGPWGHAQQAQRTPPARGFHRQP